MSFMSLAKIISSGNVLLNKHSAEVDAIKGKHLGLWIALAAGLGLFFELMIIRVHSSYFQLFAYLKNVSLLSCFLGLGIGYALATKKRLFTPLVIPMFALQIIVMSLLRFSPIAKYLQNPISESFTLGLLQTPAGLKLLFIYGFVIAVFVFNALCFIPLGHLASRLMAKSESLASYSWNLFGSLIGIILFSFISLLWTPPLVWFIIGAVLLLFFLLKEKIILIVSAVSIVAVAIVLSLSHQTNQFDIYSPYQILTLTFSSVNPPTVLTSNSYYQKILDLRPEKTKANPVLKLSDEYYSLPYSFKQKPQNVLIVGSGTGNDAAAAIRNGAGHVDAVEIDPAILETGKELHPEAPYQNPKVTAIQNDARAYIKYTDKKYDLIVYGLLDSHTLLSGRGGIRLDSYVYTVEGLKEAKSKLTDNGAISLTFALLSPDLGNKIYDMLTQAFDGKPPVVYFSQYDQGFTFVDGDKINANSVHTTFENVTDQFGKTPADVSTDDWPFFYMPKRIYPTSTVTIILMLLIVSIFIIRYFIGTKSKVGFSLPAFFLGAGFMLLETKGVTELALVYGSTWYVNSIVITSILLMGFFANLYVMRVKTLNRKIIYLALVASVIISLGFTYFKFLGQNVWMGEIIMPIELTLPMFFSGMAFSLELKRAGVPVALYSNLIGAMLGGFLEYNSMYFGFRSLYLFAIAMYLFAYLTNARKSFK